MFVERASEFTHLFRLSHVISIPPWPTGGKLSHAVRRYNVFCWLAEGCTAGVLAFPLACPLNSRDLSSPCRVAIAPRR